MPTLQETIEEAVADIAAARDAVVPDVETFSAILHGPASGVGSTVTTDAGTVKSVARTLSELASSFVATSSTSMSIATGSKSFTTQAGLSYVVGSPVAISSTLSGEATTHRMYGTVTAYDNSTGAITVSVSNVVGSGTKTAWSISLAGDAVELQNYVSAAAASATTSGASATSAAVSAAAAAAVVNTAAPNVYANTADALSNGVVSTASLVGGSGGTNGTFDVAFSGGGGTGAAGRFVVSGGALVSITITAKGRGYTSAPSMAFTASSGLSGASATAVIAANQAEGTYFNVVSEAFAVAFDLYKVVGGVAVAQQKTTKNYAVTALLDALPWGARGVYLFDERNLLNRTGGIVAPNLASSHPVSPNLFQMGRRALNASAMTPILGQVTDKAAVGPNGLTEAFALEATATTGWFCGMGYGVSSMTLPAGTYTVAAWVKQKSGTANDFWLWPVYTHHSAMTGATMKTATSSWVRYSQVCTIASPVSIPYVVCVQSGQSINGVSLYVDGMAIYEGSEDLEPDALPTLDGHIHFGRRPFDTSPVITDGLLDMTAASCVGIQQWEAATAPEMVGGTVLCLRKRTSDTTTQNAILSKIDRAHQFTFPLDKTGYGYLADKNAPTASRVVNAWRDTANKWEWYVGSQDASGLNLMGFDSYPMLRRRLTVAQSAPFGGVVATPAAVGAADCWFNVAHVYGSGDSSGGSSYHPSRATYAAMLQWDRTLTDAEIAQAQSAVESHLSYLGTVTPTAPTRIIIGDGDSISGQSEANAWLLKSAQTQALTPPTVNYAIQGAKLVDCYNRWATYMSNVAANRSGATQILYVILIGQNDAAGSSYTSWRGSGSGLAAWITDYKYLLGLVRAAGLRPVVCTLTPNNSGTYNTNRNLANTEIRTFVSGGFADLCIDFAADATIGSDAAGSNTTYYSDGIHPSATGVTAMAAIATTALDALA